MTKIEGFIVLSMTTILFVACLLITWAQKQETSEYFWEQEPKELQQKEQCEDDYQMSDAQLLNQTLNPGDGSGLGQVNPVMRYHQRMGY